MLKQEIIWHDCREELPEKPGNYMVIEGYDYCDQEKWISFCDYGKFRPFVDDEDEGDDYAGETITGWYSEYTITDDPYVPYLSTFEVINVLFWAEKIVPEEISKG